MARALATSEPRLRTAVRGAQMIICALDARGTFTFSDGGGLAALGLEPGQVVGQSVFDLYSGSPIILENTRRALAGESVTYDATLGSIDYETRYTPVFDEAGGVVGAIGVSMDVTERVRYHELLEAELERTRGQLLQVERLATLGTLAAGVGHELRNISTVLNSLRGSFTECAQRGVAPDAEELEELCWACEHVATHGRHLMDLGRPGQAKVERLDLRELVSGTLAMLRTAGTIRHVKVSSSAPESPVWVEASRTRVEQVLLNLVGNAADAVEPVRDRPMEVRVRVFQDEREGFASCCVEDTGVGIPPSACPRSLRPPDEPEDGGRPAGSSRMQAGGDVDNVPPLSTPRVHACAVCSSLRCVSSSPVPAPCPRAAPSLRPSPSPWPPSARVGRRRSPTRRWRARWSPRSRPRGWSLGLLPVPGSRTWAWRGRPRVPRPSSWSARCSWWG
jgi:PAS domain S-box-containing protein